MRLLLLSILLLLQLLFLLVQTGAFSISTRSKRPRSRPHRLRCSSSSSSSPIYDSLNPEQLAAVTSPVDNVRVTAGPGSGKTRVLVHRVAHLLQEEGIDPYQILAVTFTRKAAMEMKQRIAALVGEPILKRLTVCTLHSFCCMALRIAASRAVKVDNDDDGYNDNDNDNDNAGDDEDLLRLEYDKNFSIYDADDSRKLIKAILQGMGGLDYSPAEVQECISLLKRERLIDPRMDEKKASRIRELGLDLDVVALSREVLAVYTPLMRSSNARDFDDLVCDTLALLRSSSLSAARLKNRYCHILVDEWQDVDRAQYALLTELAEAGGRQVLTDRGMLQNEKSLFIVGDPQQTIYSWRGADPLNMRKFESQFATCAKYELKNNYRSTPGIVKAATSIIAEAATAETYEVRSVIAEEAEAESVSEKIDESVQVLCSYKDEPQAEFVAKMVAYWLQSKVASSASSIAILYRRHSLAPPIESAFIRHGVSYSVLGGPGLMNRKGVKDICAYLRLLINPRDADALRRTINSPARGVGRASEDAFFDAYAALSSPATPLLDALINLSGAGSREEEKSQDGESIASGKKKTRKKAKKSEVVADVTDEGALLSAALLPRQIKALGRAGKVFASLRVLLSSWTGSVDDLIMGVLKLTGLLERAFGPTTGDSDEAEGRRRRLEINQFMALVREYEKSLSIEGGLELAGTQIEQAVVRVQHFLDMLQLHSREQEEDEEGEDGQTSGSGRESVKKDKVRLMTLHAAKGLEFDCVMVLGLEEKCLPATGGGVFGREETRSVVTGDAEVDAAAAAAADDNDRSFIEEERRLLYVGMTRARKQLLLLYRQRMSLGTGGNRVIPVKPSRFLRSIRDMESVDWRNTA